MRHSFNSCSVLVTADDDTLQKKVLHVATTTFSIRMDEDVKKEFDQFCDKMGMTTSTAFRAL